MTEQFILEDPGEGIHEAEIREIHVAEGDRVADGDIILTVETDKAAVEVPAPFSGVIKDIRFHVGDVANVGDVIMTYRDADGSGEKAARKHDGEDKSAKTRPGEPEGREPEKKESRRDGKAQDEEEKEDGKGAAEAKSSPSKRTGQRPVPASPSTRRLARELDVDLRAVAPSGPSGRVTAADVRAAADQSAAGGEARETKARPPEGREPAARSESPGLPDFTQWGEIERVPLRSVRRTIARRMAQSWAQIPHVTHQDEADITELDAWRRQHESFAAEHDGKLTLTVLIMKALVAALKKYPRFNASIDPENEDIVLKHYYHMGMAVDTENGLLVPVIRDVDRKSIVELSAELVALADHARKGQLKRDQMQGATFTLTNPGPLGGRMMTPIIDYPQVGILGVGRAHLEPRIVGDVDNYDVVPRLMLPLCLAFDHRVNDGADAARFVTLLAETLGETEEIFLTT